MARRYWTCPRPECKYRNENSRSPKCLSCGENSRPKLRVSKHKETLRDDSYEVFERINRELHEAEPDACGVCGRPPKNERRHDRDHGHLQGDPAFGKPRGLACPGNQGCNALMPRWLTAERAQAVADYLRRVDDHYRQTIEEAA